MWSVVVTRCKALAIVVTRRGTAEEMVKNKGDEMLRALDISL